jgi:hypothetical protein
MESLLKRIYIKRTNVLVYVDSLIHELSRIHRREFETQNLVQ